MQSDHCYMRWSCVGMSVALARSFQLILKAINHSVNLYLLSSFKRTHKMTEICLIAWISLLQKSIIMSTSNLTDFLDSIY